MFILGGTQAFRCYMYKHFLNFNRYIFLGIIEKYNEYIKAMILQIFLLRASLKKSFKLK